MTARFTADLRAKRIERAARAVIKETNNHLDYWRWPQKYTAPYGALVKLIKALES